MEVSIGHTKVGSKRAIKYLDDRLNFKEHMKYIGEKVSVTQGTLRRMMPNIGGPNPFKRRRISRIITSIISYAW